MNKVKNSKQNQILNKEQGISNKEVEYSMWNETWHFTSSFSIPCSLFDIHKFFPVFRRPSCMWNNDRSANNIGNGKYFIHFFSVYTKFV